MKHNWFLCKIGPLCQWLVWRWWLWPSFTKETWGKVFRETPRTLSPLIKKKSFARKVFSLSPSFQPGMLSYCMRMWDLRWSSHFVAMTHSKENQRHTRVRELVSHQMDSEASQPPLDFLNNKCLYDLSHYLSGSVSCIWTHNWLNNKTC